MNNAIYYATIRAKGDELTKQNPSGFCLIVSVHNLQKNSTAGNIAEVSNYNAARFITEGTHRVATDTEVQTYQQQQSSIRARNHNDELARLKEEFAAVTKGLV